MAVRFRRAGTGETVASSAMDRQADGHWKSHAKVVPTAGWLDADFSVTDAQAHETTRTVPNYVHVLRRTAIAGLPVDPIKVAKGRPEVVISGKVIEYTRTPPAALVVGGRVVLAHGASPSAEAATEGSGRFAFTVPSPGRQGASYTVDFPAQGDFAPSSARVSVVLARQAARIRIDPLRVAQPVASGSRVTVTGTFEVHGNDGGWYPGGYGQQVRVGGRLVDVVKGRFTGTTVLSAGSPVSVSFDGDDDYAPTAAALPLDVRDRTTLRAGSSPARVVARGGRVALEGFLDRDADGLPGRPVDLEFSADGKRWTAAAHGRTGQYGRVVVAATARKDGRWRLRFPGVKDSLLASTGPSSYVDVRNPVRFTAFNASPEPVRKGKAITVRGRLLHQIGSSWKPVAHGTQIEVRFRPAKPGGLTGTMLAVGRDGWFTLTTPARADGYWEAHFPGSRDDVEGWSAADYVDVR